MRAWRVLHNMLFGQSRRSAQSQEHCIAQSLVQSQESPRRSTVGGQPRKRWREHAVSECALHGHFACWDVEFLCGVDAFTHQRSRVASFPPSGSRCHGGSAAVHGRDDAERRVRTRELEDRERGEGKQAVLREKGRTGGNSGARCWTARTEKQ